MATVVHIDATVEESDMLQLALDGYIEGNGDIAADVKEVLMSGGVDAEALKNVSVAGLLNRLGRGGNDETKNQLLALLQDAFQTKPQR